MIIESDCVYPTLYDEVNSIMVLIKSANWPIVISWDSTLFQDSCRAMAIIECEPGGWFDVCGGNNRFLVLEMEEINRFSFVRTVYTIPTETDTLFALFFPLSRKIDVGIGKILNKPFAFGFDDGQRLDFLNGFNRLFELVGEGDVGIKPLSQE